MEKRSKTHRMIGTGTTKWIALSVLAMAFASATVFSAKTEAPELSFDGLTLKQGSKAGIVYIDPEADFAVYRRFMMLEPYIAFRKNWERDTRVAGRRVPKKHIEKIKVEAADLLQEVFQEVLEEKDGYQRVTEAGDDVLLLRPALIDLDVTAPDVPTAGRTTQYVSSSVGATLYLELYDSVTGDILGRAVDRAVVRAPGQLQWSTSVSNRADAKKIFKTWATWLRGAWDDVHAQYEPMQG